MAQVTLERATIGTVINKSGTGVIESIPVNQPRFDYDPFNQTPIGLRIEAEATNLIPFSAGAANLTVTGLEIGTEYTYSFYDIDEVFLSGAVETRLFGNQFYPNRTEFTFTALVTSLNISYTYGNAHHCQLEKGSFATSYIPTVSTAAIRSADKVFVPPTDFTRWFNQTQGTLLIYLEKPKKINESLPVLTLRNGTGPTNLNHLDLYFVPYHYLTLHLKNEVKALTYAKDISAFSSILKIAVTYSLTDIKMFINGEKVLDVPHGFPDMTGLGVDRLFLGHDGVFNFNESLKKYLNSTIHKFKYSREVLSDAQLLSLTT